MYPGVEDISISETNNILYAILKAIKSSSTYVAPVNNYAFVNQSIVLGDSISTENYGASAASIIAGNLGIAFANKAISGSNINTQALLYFKEENTRYLANGNKPNPLPLYCFTGFNDIRVNNGQQTRYEAVKAAYRSICAYQFSNREYLFIGNNQNPNVTGSLAATGIQGLENLNSVLLNNDNANISNLDFSYKLAGSFLNLKITGTSVVIGTWGRVASYPFSRIKVEVDGVEKTIYDPNGKHYATIVNDAIVIIGLSNTQHDVKLTFLDNAYSGLDWFGTLKKPAECKAVYILDMPHMTSDIPGWGYNYPGGVTTEAILDECSLQRKNDLQTTFANYPLVFVDINKAGYYEPSIHLEQINQDRVHPTSIGNQKIAQRFLELHNSYL